MAWVASGSPNTTTEGRLPVMAAWDRLSGQPTLCAKHQLQEEEENGMKASTAINCNANKNSLDGGKRQHDHLYLVASLQIKQ
jgi:hypothetical protein